MSATEENAGIAQTTSGESRPTDGLTGSRPGKIFIFIDGQTPWGDVLGQAIAEDGTPLAGHCSSSLWFLRHDMGLHPDNWQHDKYAAHYPNGYELVDVIGEPGHVEKHAECMAAIALCNAKNATSAPLPYDSTVGATEPASDAPVNVTRGEP